MTDYISRESVEKMFGTRYGEFTVGTGCIAGNGADSLRKNQTTFAVMEKGKE